MSDTFNWLAIKNYSGSPGQKGKTNGNCVIGLGLESWEDLLHHFGCYPLLRIGKKFFDIF
jgi:hypothetical protein